MVTRTVNGSWFTRMFVLVAAVSACGDDVTGTSAETTSGSTGAIATTTAMGSTSETTAEQPTTSGTASIGETMATTGSMGETSTSEAMTTTGTSTADPSTSSGAADPSTSTADPSTSSSTGDGELCGNGIDDDGDDEIDEDCPCVDDETQPCLPFPESGVGACTPGTQACVGGTWGACEGAVGPQDELCNLLDDDCDGETDEMCTCEEGEEVACYPGPEGTADVGICESGTQTCVIMNGEPTLGPCEGFVLPAAEDACNDMLDNDCDGKVDIQTASLGKCTDEMITPPTTCSDDDLMPDLGGLTTQRRACRRPR